MLPADDGLRLIAYTIEPGSESAHALALPCQLGQGVDRTIRGALTLRSRRAV